MLIRYWNCAVKESI